MKLQTNLKKLLKAKKMSIASLADIANIPASNIKTWLAGSSPRNLNDLRVVAQILKIEFEHLLFEDLEKLPEEIQEDDVVLDGMYKIRLERVHKDE